MGRGSLLGENRPTRPDQRKQNATTGVPFIMRVQLQVQVPGPYVSAARS